MIMTNKTEDYNENDINNKFQKKIMNKSGKTLMVRSFNNFKLNDLLFNELEGFENKSFKNDGNIVFLTFDTPQNSLNGLKTLKQKSSDLKFKFSYYKVFFTINGLSDSDDYNVIKKDISDFIFNETGANVLYCKLYCKNNKYLGCGDLTIDTLDGIVKLLSKDCGLKEYSFKSYSGCFYKFNDKKES